MHYVIRRFLCLLFFCYTVFSVASGASSEPLQVSFALPAIAKRTFNESNALFQTTVRDKLGDVLKLQEILFKSSGEVRDALKSGSVDIAILSTSSFRNSFGGFFVGSNIKGSRLRQESEVGAYQLALLEQKFDPVPGEFLILKRWE